MVSNHFSKFFNRIGLVILIGLMFSCGRQIPTEQPQPKKTDSELLKIQKQQKEQSISRLDTIAFETEILRVIDGDTAEIIYYDLFMRLRLDHIDAPETRGSQPFGKAAGKYLRERIEGKKVTVVCQRKTDGFGRLIATIYTEEGENINKTMVENGYAWHYKKYSKDDSYDVLEQEARKHKRGLWETPNPVAPWNFRKK